MSAILTTPGCGDRPVCSGIRGPYNRRPLIDQGHTCICAWRRVKDLERQFRVIRLERRCNIVFGKRLRYSAKITDRFIRMGITQSPILREILHQSIKKGGYHPVTNKWVPPSHPYSRHGGRQHRRIEKHVKGFNKARTSLAVLFTLVYIHHRRKFASISHLHSVGK
jgi:hypothetical protein